MWGNAGGRYWEAVGRAFQTSRRRGLKETRLFLTRQAPQQLRGYLSVKESYSARASEVSRLARLVAMQF
jgi:hypothetical protein